MRSSQTLSLFSDRPETNQRPTSFLVSVVTHCVLISLIVLGAMYAPRLNDRALMQQYALQQIELQTELAQRRRAAENDQLYPGPLPINHTPNHTAPPEGKPTPRPPASQQMAKAVLGRQTLVQPDLPTNLPPIPLIPVPTVVLWSSPKTHVKMLVPPKPDKPTSAMMKPSLEMPNKAVRVADVRITPTEITTLKMPVLPSTTSPLVVHGPNLPQKAPTTTSTSNAQPTPTAALSISNTQMTKGTAYLPPANQTTASTSSGSMSQEQGKGSSQSGKGEQAGKAGGTGTGQGSESHTGAKTGLASGADTGSGSGDLFSTTHIALDKSGQFGAVVVGNSMQDKYPESASILGGKVVYTVYLHLGLAKSWIFQYTVPNSDDAAAGDTTSLEAPWPYDIVRPNMPPDLVDADVLMVHGFINKDGHFEALAVIFPPEFPQARFVVDALKQWAFRPAMRNGQVARVEVLLIIPQEQE
jgi:hypothetical protein